MPFLSQANRLLSLCAALGMSAAGPLAAQAPQSPMELNRAGRWAQAAEAARSILANPATSTTERCEARTHVVSALARLGRADEAKAEAATFERECASLPANHWTRRQMARTGIAGIRVDTLVAAPVRRPTVVRPAPDDDWRTASPAALGMDTTALAAHRDLCERSGADACVVVHKGALVQEWYGPYYTEPMMAMSSTKSVTGLLAGMLVGDGKLSADDPVARYIPRWRAGAEAGVTVRHLLTMTSGLPDFPADAREVGSVTDKETFVFGLPLATRPGEAWAYSNDGAFLLSPLLDRAAGEPVEDYAVRRLFAPLGMRRTRLHVYPEEQAWTHADMETTPRDLARVGQLMLDGGRWGGKQVVPEAWVRASVQPSQRVNPQYGLLWWLDVPGGFASRGYLDTSMYVFPAQELVVVRMQARRVPGAADYERTALGLFARMTQR